MHDWTKVEAGIYHDFHNLWLMAIRHTLNNGVLPEGYYAMSEQKSVGIEADLLALQTSLTPTNGVPAPAGMSPVRAALRPAVGILEREEKAPRRRAGRRLTVRHVSNHTVIAVVELVSPGNKDSRSHHAKFVAKAVDLLAADLHVLVIDPFPPPAHAPAGLHASIWKKVTRSRKGHRPFTLSAERSLLAASYCTSSSSVTAAVQTFAVGDPVPDIPLYLTADQEYVTIPLEQTYQAAWPEVPKLFRDVLEG